MSKRNVAFIKPDEPTFLKKLKAQVGYQEGPTIDTKRDELEILGDKDLEDIDEEQPTVVVLKSGDLTAEEVAVEKMKIERELASAPADLKQRIVFKPPIKEASDHTEFSKKTSTKPSRNNSKKIVDKRLLSFDNEDEDL